MRKSKYGNKKITALGMKFDSKGEYNRYLFLLDQQKRGRLSQLKCQIKYPIIVEGQYICYYVADFTYYKNNKLIVEDFKGVVTAIFRLKAKLMKATHNIDIKIVKSPIEEI